MTDYNGCKYPQQRKAPKCEPCQGSITPLPENYTVTMLYVPMQTDTAMFDEMKAFECGTLFPVLNKPFAGKCCR